MEYCDDDREYIRVVTKTDPFPPRKEGEYPNDTMDLLTPISRDQLKMYSELPQHITTVLQLSIREVYNAIHAKKTSCLLETAIRHLQVKGEIGHCQYDPTPKFGIPDFIALLHFKFPGCKIEFIEDQWRDVNPTTRKKVTGILIDWS